MVAVAVCLENHDGPVVDPRRLRQRHLVQSVLSPTELDHNGSSWVKPKLHRSVGPVDHLANVEPDERGSGTEAQAILRW